MLTDFTTRSLQLTKWPFESNGAAQDLLNRVRGMPSQLDLEYYNPDPQTAIKLSNTLLVTLKTISSRAIEDLLKKVTDAAFKYTLESFGRGRDTHPEGDATGCTEALNTCREELRSLIPVSRLLMTR